MEERRRFRLLSDQHPRAVDEEALGQEGPEREPDPQTELARLRAALEDVVALANTDAEARQRLILMQRRAIAALTGKDRAL